MEPTISYYPNGNIRDRNYMDNKYHRENGPAYESFYVNGNCECKSYYINGKFHRTDGPAYQAFYEDESIKYIEFYINDCKYTEEAFYARLNNLEIFE